ncbi:hypothetical protein TNIN_298791 [Trichonephila inaurata madagascariensis]|uniref:Endonuclease/exonuclease/phosphatase domain-containing protein n=1 Tax=Trichonephila inaurata madagascariensis TaxID=2747483 RepID=A0A8X7CDZ8_9ARAC|nr:hypothetical protein TNIN_298791 [Trichonephila inaurata madagascariensis]
MKPNLNSNFNTTLDRPSGSGGGLVLLIRNLNFNKVFIPVQDSNLELQDRSSTHTSFSYGTSEALDITLVSPELYLYCKWTVLNGIGSDHLPIMIDIKGHKFYSETSRNFWNFKKAKWEIYNQLSETTFCNQPFGDNLEQEW